MPFCIVSFFVERQTKSRKPRIYAKLSLCDKTKQFTSTPFFYFILGIVCHMIHLSCHVNILYHFVCKDVDFRDVCNETS